MPLLSRFPVVNKVFFLFCAIVFLGCAGAAPAGATDVFTIRNVPVDVRAQSAASARQQAHALAQEQAFKILLKKLTLVTDHGRIDSVRLEDPAAYISSMEVKNEKTSSNRYLADITVEFNAQAIRQFLQHNRMQYAETVSRPLVVIPLFRQDGRLVLWEETNPWQRAWRNYEASLGLIPVVVPEADAETIRSFPAESAERGDMQAIQAIARQHRASAVLIPYATLKTDRAGLPYMELAATYYRLDGGERTLVETFENQGTIQALLEGARNTTMAALEQQWKLENLIQSGESDRLALRIPFSSLKEWVRLQNKFRSIGVIKQFQLDAFSNDHADVTLVYSGNQGSLLNALRQNDLAVESRQGRYVLINSRNG